MNLIVLFIILNVINVLVQTAKSIITIKGTKLQASLVNAVAFGFYTIVVVYMVSDIPLMLKVLIVAITNFFGVYIVKWIEEKKTKDRLWKIEFTAHIEELQLIKCALERENVSFSYVEAGRYVIFNTYCATQTDTNAVKTAMRWSDAKYFITESRGTL